MFSRGTKIHTEETVAKKQSKIIKYLTYGEKRKLEGHVLYFFGPTFFLRQFFFVLLFNPITHLLRYLITFINIIMFIIGSYIKTPQYNITYSIVNIVCLSLLTVDVILQMLTLGFFMGKHSFLRYSFWSAFDVFIVVVGWCLIAWIKFSAFRFFIIFRILSAIPFLSDLRSILHSFWNVTPKLVGIVIITFVIYLIFVVTGVDFFHSDIGKRCVYIEKDTYIPANNSILTIEDFTESGNLTLTKLDNAGIVYHESVPVQWCDSDSISNPIQSFCEIKENSQSFWCGFDHFLSGYKCEPGFRCLNGNENLKDGYASFDNWGASAVVTFQMISLSGWSDFYNALASTETGISAMIWLYFLMFAFSFILINIIISAIDGAFSRAKNVEIEERSKNVSTFGIFYRILKHTPSAISGKIAYHLSLKIPFITFFLQIRNFITIILQSFVFDVFITFVVILNVTIEIIFDEFFPELPLIVLPFTVFGETYQVGTIVSDVFLFIYLFEAILKILFIGFKYFQSFYNLIDLSLVGLLLFVFILRWLPEGTLSGFDPFAYFFIFRMVRLINVLTRFPITRVFMHKVSKSIFPSISVVFFIGSVILLFSFVGTMIYNSSSTSENSEDTKNGSLIDGFQDFFRAFLTMFIIFTGDNWEDSMYEGIKLSNLFPKIVSIPFFIMYFIISNYFLLSFFAAVLLGAFTGAKENKDDEWVKFVEKLKTFWEKAKKILAKFFCISIDDESEKKKGEKNCWKSFHSAVCRVKNSTIYIILNLFFTAIASFILVLDDPVSAYDIHSFKVNEVAVYIEIVLCTLFFFDFFLSLFCEGFKYFLNFLNYLDMVFLIEMIVSLVFFGTQGFATFKLPWLYAYIRIGIRTLRPIKILIIFPDLRVYLESFKNTIFSFFQLGILLVLCYLIFAILGKQLFKNRFHSCNDSNVFNNTLYDANQKNSSEFLCVGNFNLQEYNILIPRVFENFAGNFDSLLNGMLTLIEFSTLDQWSVSMLNVYEQQNDEFSRALESFFFIVYIVVVVLFIITISVSIIVDAIMTVRQTHNYTEKQKYWSYIKRYMYTTNPIPQKKPIIKFVGIIVNHWSFKLIFGTIVFFNYIVLSLQYSGQHNIYELVIDLTCLLFFSIYIIEDCIKFFGVGFIYFFSDIFMIVDIVVCIIGIIMGLVYVIYLPFGGGAELFRARYILKIPTRAFLYLRIISLIGEIKSVKKITRTLSNAIPSFLNALILLSCALFAYVLLGRSFFGPVRYGENYNVYANFRQWDKSLVLLSRVLTFDNWRAIMNDLAVEEPYCTVTDDFNDCGIKWMALLYFYSFIFLVSTILLNIFIGIILDNFSMQFVEEYEITREVIDDVKVIWAKYDPFASGMIRMQKIRNVITELYLENNKLSFDPSTRRGNEMFWVIYFELQSGIEYTKGEKEENKYLVRFNIFHWIYGMTKSLKKKWNELKNFLSRLDMSISEEVQPFKKTDLKRIYFNSFLLTLGRMKFDNSYKTVEERKQRRVFLNKAVENVNETSITKIRSDWAVEKMENSEWNFLKKNVKKKKKKKKKKVKTPPPRPKRSLIRDVINTHGVDM